MSSQSHRLLIYGRDPLLLETRRLLLEIAGYETDAVASELAFTDKLVGSQSQYGLAIFCYTLPHMARAAAHVFADKAGVPVWQLESLTDPPAFIAGVSKYLAD
jgi:hypothetical protein